MTNPRSTLLVAALAWLVALGALADTAAPAAQDRQANPTLPKVTLDVAGTRVRAEVADTPRARELGLMNRFSVGPDDGMLFVFAQPQQQAFWMHNTYMPLSIAYIDADGRILNVDEMAPRTDDPHWSKGPALYALEMRSEWFARHGIAAGATVKGLPKPSSN
jgi:uncharacterized protein